jgi:hypothetical protein
VTLPGATTVMTMLRGLAELGCFLASSITAKDARAAVPVGNLTWLAVDRESGDAVVQ